MKQNQKHNILKKALTAVGALLTTVALTTVALADIWYGVPGSKTFIITNPDDPEMRYGYWSTASQPSFKVSWRVTVYVAKSDDGTIDPLADTITNDNLGYIGTILYDNFQNGHDVFLQKTQNTETRYASLPRNYPRLAPVTSADRQIEDSDSGHGTPIYHSTDDCGLPTYTSACSASKIQSIAQSDEFASQVIEHLNVFLGGTSSNLKPIYARIAAAGACKSGTIAGQKLADAYKSKGLAGYEVLLPTKPDGSPNPDCVVEWVCVVEPIVGIETLKDTSFFDTVMKGDDRLYHRAYCGLGSVGSIMGIDAYAIGQYNEYSKENYASDAFIRYSIEPKLPGFEAYKVWASEKGTYKDYYKDKGKLRTEISTNLPLCATITYDNHSGVNSYCGVPVAGSAGSSLSYATSAQQASTYGGIAVFKTEISEDESIPINYYIRTYTATKDQLKEATGKDTLTDLTDNEILKVINNLDLSYNEVKVSKSLEKTVKSYTPVGDSNIAGIPVAEQSLAELKDTPKYTKQIIPTAIATYGSPTKPLTKVTNTLTITDKVKEVDVLSVKLVLETEDAPDTPSSSSSRPDDRIKTMDVTQLITVDQNSTPHLNSFSSYLQNNYDDYNTGSKYQSTFQSYNQTHKESNGVWITNSAGASTKHDYMKEENTVTQTCTASCYSTSSHSPQYKDILDDKGNKIGSEYSHCISNTCNWKCGSVKHQCVYSIEVPKAVFGKSSPPGDKAKWELKNGTDTKLTQKKNWKEPDQVEWTTVGMTVPGVYYSKAGVVKLSGSGITGTYNHKMYPSMSAFFLPTNETITHNGLISSAHATLDLLLGKQNSNEDYWIRYLTASDQIIGSNNFMQYAQFDDTQDKQVDISSQTGDGQFNWKSSETTMDKVQFLAHRDLLSGDNIATSLAVSGYMSKYASNSYTTDYLSLMKNAGFTFTGLDPASLSKISKGMSEQQRANLTYNLTEINQISHDLRTVQIANELKPTAISASKSGSASTEYNTDYTGGLKGSLADQYKARFGLGGTSTHGGDIYTHIPNTNLNDTSLNTSDNKGDVVRTAWYYCDKAKSSTGGNCYGKETTHRKHTNTGSCGHGHGSFTHSSHYDQADTLGTSHKDYLDSCKGVPGREYIEQTNDGYYIDTMNKTKTHMSVDANNKASFTGAISTIEASRTSFLVNLAVEGTTAGQYETSAEHGLTYKPTAANGKSTTSPAKDYDYVVDSKTNALKLKPTKDTEESKSWTENTFELHTSNYQHVGSADENESKDGIIAEYRLTTPTHELTFNPSYYMLFDDEFENNNKSVWMLSEQPRSTTMKNALIVRLRNEALAELKSGKTASYVYSTHIASEWSTELSDTKCHETTKLPVMKAGNTYTTTTEKSGGTVTMYVVLQDPEFTSNPNDTQKYNDKIMQQYLDEANKLVKQFAEASTKTGEAMTKSDNKDQLSIAMYSNMVNASSKNSAYQVAPVTNVAALADKEPMILDKNTKLTYEITTGGKNSGNGGAFNNWSFYALAGYEVNPFSSDDDLGAITGQCKEANDTDLSDTTSAGYRKIKIGSNTATIQTMTKASAHQKEYLNELNDRLCMLMVEPFDKKTDATTLAYPTGTTPFLSDGNFNWYSEDYEGLVVGVFEIDYTIRGNTSEGTKDARAEDAFTTDYRAVYRGESDWRSDFNSLAAEEGHDLTVYTNLGTAGFTNFYNAGNTDLDETKAKDLVQLDKNGNLQLISEEGKRTLADWSKESFNKTDYAKGIYGVGLELANLNIKFGTDLTLQDGTKVTPIGGTDGAPISFFYQPTYFNIRGSVYDTAR